jgi:hypothetical protein
MHREVQLFGISEQLLRIEHTRGVQKPTAGFHIGSDDIEAKRRLVVYPGNHSFLQGSNVETLPLQVLMEELSG